MLLVRKAYQDLLKWKQTDQGRTALLIEGARRVGKSFLAKTFAQNEYRSFIYIDFSLLPPVVKELFEDYAHDLDDFFARLSNFYRTRLHQRESCIIFDEVQLFPKARQLIKHLVEDGRYDYIETGSLISLKRNVADIVIPSEEFRLELRPLDFEEFLTAVGRTSNWQFIRERFEKNKPLGDALHRDMMKLLRTYMIVGGMPQAVSSWAEHRDLAAVARIHKTILELYRDDIAQYAEGCETKVRAIFDAIPSQLAQRDKKFRLSRIQSEARMRTYENAFLWLSASKIVDMCCNSTDPSVGLLMNPEFTRLKCYMADTGLLTALSTLDGSVSQAELANDLLYGKLSLNESMFFENLVAQMLRSTGRRLFFYTKLRNDGSRRSLEIDFLIHRARRICPLAVKSDRCTPHRSLDLFIDKYKERIGKRYVVCTKDLKTEGELVYLPAYMTPLL